MTLENHSVNESASIGWTFLSNHGHVLLCIAREPDARLRDVADRVGITERAVQRIVSDLEAGGYLSRERQGRRNVYRLHADRPLRHPIESHREIRSLLSLVLSPSELRELSVIDISRNHPSDRNAVDPGEPRIASSSRSLSKARIGDSSD